MARRVRLAARAVAQPNGRRVQSCGKQPRGEAGIGQRAAGEVRRTRRQAGQWDATLARDFAAQQHRGDGSLRPRRGPRANPHDESVARGRSGVVRPKRDRSSEHPEHEESDQSSRHTHVRKHAVFQYGNGEGVRPDPLRSVSISLTSTISGRDPVINPDLPRGKHRPKSWAG
jgi:hypothetical protein